MKKTLLHLFIVASILVNWVVVLIDYKPVYAASTNLTVDGVVSQSGRIFVTYIGGATDYTNLNSDDGDVTYANDNASFGGSWPVSGWALWSFSTFAISHIEINSVTLYVKARGASSIYGIKNSVEASVYTSGNYYDSGTFLFPTVTDLNYYTGNKTWANNPATGSKWTAAEVNASLFGIKHSKVYDAYYTYMYLEIDYDPATVPVVTTQSASNVIYSGAAHYALLNGNITSNGGNTTDVRGFVYGTTSNSTNPGNVAPASTSYTTNSSAYSSVIGAYTSNVTGMAANTRYYVRAFAHNGIGYGYGDEVNFITLGNPTVSNLSATLVGSTTAQLNSQVTFDGNSTCNITFGWGLGSGAWGAYTVHTNVAGTYNTGQFPLLALSSLNASSTYYYMVRIQNSFGTAYGTELSFTTSSGIAEPTASTITAIPSSTTISCLWTKGSGSASTLCRYSTGTYPTTTAQGTLAYLGTGNSVLVTGLTPGTTYYFSYWGMTGGVYSTNYTTSMATTMAYGSATTPTASTPPTDSRWNQTPDSTLLENIPWINTLFASAASEYNMPVVTVWYFVWIVLAIGIGFWMYNKRRNVVGSFMVECAWMGLGAFLGLTMLWIVAILLIIAIGFTIYGDRR